MADFIAWRRVFSCVERNEPDLVLASLDRAIEAREHGSSPYRVDDQIERGRLLCAARDSSKPWLPSTPHWRCAATIRWRSGCGRRRCFGWADSTP